MHQSAHTVPVVLTAMLVSAAVQARPEVTVFGMVDTVWNHACGKDDIGSHHNF